MTEQERAEVRKQRKINRGMVILMLGSIKNDKKNELRKMYFNPDVKCPYENDYQHAIGVGSFHHLLLDVMFKGATEDEIHRMLMHLQVLIDCRKWYLDATKSYQDNNIEEIVKKYFPGSELGKRTERARKAQLELAPKKRRAIVLHEEGKSNEEIAKELDIPESTVRYLLGKLAE